MRLSSKIPLVRPASLLVRNVLPPALACAFIAAAAPTSAAQALDSTALRVADLTFADLTHPLNESTLYWPTSPSRFELERLAYGVTAAGFFYAANAFSAPEHGGTHVDAPIHFAEGRRTVDRIPLEQLVAPAVVIDVSAKADADHDYRLSVEDVLTFEARHGTIAPGTIILLRTGWSRFWPDVKAYLGDDTPGDASKLHFPSYGEEAAHLLVERRKVAMLGVDTASIDYGASQDFIVHRVANGADVPGLENLTNLESLPPTGALVVALPIKIEGGSGGPARVIAILPPAR